MRRSKILYIPYGWWYQIEPLQPSVILDTAIHSIPIIVHNIFAN
jgi:hypothetical protein